MIRNKLYLSIIILTLLSCRQQKQPQDFGGIWCDEFKHCVYFDNELCMLYSQISKYEFNDSNIVVEDTFKVVYEFEITNDTLRMSRSDDKTIVQHYTKVSPLNNLQFNEISFSVASVFEEFNLKIDSTNQYWLDLKYSSWKEAGQYTGKITEGYKKALNTHLNLMDLNKKSKVLKPEIISDISEWALEIKTNDGAVTTLYHNYKDIGHREEYISRFLSHFPISVDIKRGTINQDLGKIEAFRQSEFQRNLSETK